MAPRPLHSLPACGRRALLASGSVGRRAHGHGCAVAALARGDVQVAAGPGRPGPPALDPAPRPKPRPRTDATMPLDAAEKARRSLGYKNDW